MGREGHVYDVSATAVHNLGATSAAVRHPEPQSVSGVKLRAQAAGRYHSGTMPERQ